MDKLPTIVLLIAGSCLLSIYVEASACKNCAFQLNRFCCQREHEVWENNPGKKICCYFHEPNDTKPDTGGRAINWCDSKHLYGLRTQNFTNVHPVDMMAKIRVKNMDSFVEDTSFKIGTLVRNRKAIKNAFAAALGIPRKKVTVFFNKDKWSKETTLGVMVKMYKDKATNDMLTTAMKNGKRTMQIMNENLKKTGLPIRVQSGRKDLCEPDIQWVPAKSYQLYFDSGVKLATGLGIPVRYPELKGEMGMCTDGTKDEICWDNMKASLERALAPVFKTSEYKLNVHQHTREINRNNAMYIGLEIKVRTNAEMDNLFTKVINQKDIKSKINDALKSIKTPTRIAIRKPSNKRFKKMTWRIVHNGEDKSVFRLMANTPEISHFTNYLAEAKYRFGVDPLADNDGLMINVMAPDNKAFALLTPQDKKMLYDEEFFRKVIMRKHIIHGDPKIPKKPSNKFLAKEEIQRGQMQMKVLKAGYKSAGGSLQVVGGFFWCGTPEEPFQKKSPFCYGGKCSKDDDCMTIEKCEGGKCTQLCKGDDDCPWNKECMNGKCVKMDQQNGTIPEVLTEWGFFTLRRLVGEYGLLATLKDKGPFTVFAPVEAAFDNIPIGDLGKEKIKKILLGHVVKGSEIKGNDIKDGETKIKSVGGTMITIKKENGVINVNPGGAKVIEADLKATNGVIHGIDKLIIEP